MASEVRIPVAVAMEGERAEVEEYVEVEKLVAMGEHALVHLADWNLRTINITPPFGGKSEGKQAKNIKSIKQKTFKTA